MDKSTQELVDDGFKYQHVRDKAEKAFTAVKDVLKERKVTDAISSYGTLLTSTRVTNQVNAEKLAKCIKGSDELVEILKCANFNISKLTAVLGPRAGDIITEFPSAAAMTFRATPDGKKKLESEIVDGVILE